MKHNRPLTDRLKEKSVLRANGCFEWIGARNPAGYGHMKIGGRKGKFFDVHRISWQIYSGMVVPDGMHVLHKCDNPSCINPLHLFLGTNQDNSTDKVSKGRQSRGMGRPKSKLNYEKVFAIRWRAAMGETQRSLAAEYGVTPSTLNCAVHGSTWQFENHD